MWFVGCTGGSQSQQAWRLAHFQPPSRVQGRVLLHVHPAFSLCHCHALQQQMPAPACTPTPTPGGEGLPPSGGSVPQSHSLYSECCIHLDSDAGQLYTCVCSQNSLLMQCNGREVSELACGWLYHQCIANCAKQGSGNLSGCAAQCVLWKSYWNCPFRSYARADRPAMQAG